MCGWVCEVGKRSGVIKVSVDVVNVGVFVNESKGLVAHGREESAYRCS